MNHKKLGNVSAFPTLQAIFQASQKARDAIVEQYKSGKIKEAFDAVEEENRDFWGKFILEMAKLNLIPPGLHNQTDDNIDVCSETGDITWNTGQQTEGDQDFDAVMAAFAGAGALDGDVSEDEEGFGC